MPSPIPNGNRGASLPRNVGSSAVANRHPHHAPTEMRRAVSPSPAGLSQSHYRTSGSASVHGVPRRGSDPFPFVPEDRHGPIARGGAADWRLGRVWEWQQQQQRAASSSVGPTPPMPVAWWMNGGPQRSTETESVMSWSRAAGDDDAMSILSGSDVASSVCSGSTLMGGAPSWWNGPGGSPAGGVATVGAAFRGRNGSMPRTFGMVSPAGTALRSPASVAGATGGMDPDVAMEEGTEDAEEEDLAEAMGQLSAWNERAGGWISKDLENSRWDRDEDGDDEEEATGDERSVWEELQVLSKSSNRGKADGGAEDGDTATSEPPAHLESDRARLVWAILKGHAGVVKFFLLQGTLDPAPVKTAKKQQDRASGRPAPLSTQTGNPVLDPARGMTCLHIAAAVGKLEVVRALVGCGAKVTVRAKDGTTPLHCAAAGGHLEVVAYLVEMGGPRALKQLVCTGAEGPAGAGRDIGKRNDGGQSALQPQARGSKVPLRRGSLSSMLSSTSSSTSSTPSTLPRAGSRGSPVTSLSSSTTLSSASTATSAKPRASPTGGWTPLHVAAMTDRAEVLAWLIDVVGAVGGASAVASCLSLRTAGRLWTPAMAAAWAGRTDAMAMLTKVAAAVSGAGANGWAEVVENDRDRDGRTAVHLAARGGHAETVALLVRGIGDPAVRERVVRVRDRQGITAVHLACLSVGKPRHDPAAAASPSKSPTRTTSRGLQTLQTLLEACGSAPAVAACQDREGWTPIHYAAAAGNVDALKKLMASCQANMALLATRFGWTPLHIAARWDRGEVVQVLMAATKPEEDEAEPAKSQTREPATESLATRPLEGTDHLGLTPLHVAAWNAASEALAAMLTSGAQPCDIVVRGSKGWTALHLAAVSGAAAATRHGAACSRGKRRADVARRLVAAVGFEALLVGIGAGRAALDADDSDMKKVAGGLTAVHLAALVGDAELVDALLDGLDVSLGQKILLLRAGAARRTPLHLAVRHGHGMAATALMARGGRMEAVEGDGRSVLEVALAEGRRGGGRGWFGTAVSGAGRLERMLEEECGVWGCEAFREALGAVLRGEDKDVDGEYAFGEVTETVSFIDTKLQPLTDDEYVSKSHEDSNAASDLTPPPRSASLNTSFLTPKGLLETSATGDELENMGDMAPILPLSSLWTLAASALVLWTNRVAAAAANGAGEGLGEAGRTLVHAAAERGDAAELWLLLELGGGEGGQGAGVGAEDGLGRTPLHFAAERDRAAAAAVLLGGARGNEVEMVRASNRFGWTPLHLAALNGAWRVLEVIADMKRKAEVGRAPAEEESDYDEGEREGGTAWDEALDAADSLGCTPLHHAVRQGMIPAAKVLVANGADPEARDGEGRPVFGLAEAMLANATKAVQAAASEAAGGTSGKVAHALAGGLQGEWMLEEKKVKLAERVRVYIEMVRVLKEAIAAREEARRAKEASRSGASDVDAEEARGRKAIALGEERRGREGNHAVETVRARVAEKRRKKEPREGSRVKKWFLTMADNVKGVQPEDGKKKNMSPSGTVGSGMAAWFFSKSTRQASKTVEPDSSTRAQEEVDRKQEIGDGDEEVVVVVEEGTRRDAFDDKENTVPFSVKESERGGKGVTRGMRFKDPDAFTLNSVAEVSFTEPNARMEEIFIFYVDQLQGFRSAPLLRQHQRPHNPAADVAAASSPHGSLSNSSLALLPRGPADHSNPLIMTSLEYAPGSNYQRTAAPIAGQVGGPDSPELVPVAPWMLLNMPPPPPPRPPPVVGRQQTRLQASVPRGCPLNNASTPSSQPGRDDHALIETHNFANGRQHWNLHPPRTNLHHRSTRDQSGPHVDDMPADCIPMLEAPSGRPTNVSLSPPQTVPVSARYETLEPAMTPTVLATADSMAASRHAGFGAVPKPGPQDPANIDAFMSSRDDDHQLIKCWSEDFPFPPEIVNHSKLLRARVDDLDEYRNRRLKECYARSPALVPGNSCDASRGIDGGFLSDASGAPQVSWHGVPIDDVDEDAEVEKSCTGTGDDGSEVEDFADEVERVHYQPPRWILAQGQEESPIPVGGEFGVKSGEELGQEVANDNVPGWISEATPGFQLAAGDDSRFTEEDMARKAPVEESKVFVYVKLSVDDVDKDGAEETTEPAKTEEEQERLHDQEVPQEQPFRQELLPQPAETSYLAVNAVDLVFPVPAAGLNHPPCGIRMDSGATIVASEPTAASESGSDDAKKKRKTNKFRDGLKMMMKRIGKAFKKVFGGRARAREAASAN
ncbi:hypothetical protein HDU96_006939 [Phlyctochytrium bullatum]|nr:hypothetical protein HDU96_006939 [Phlyctochytrium bullatum]